MKSVSLHYSGQEIPRPYSKVIPTNDRISFPSSNLLVINDDWEANRTLAQSEPWIKAKIDDPRETLFSFHPVDEEKRSASLIGKQVNLSELEKGGRLLLVLHLHLLLPSIGNKTPTKITLPSSSALGGKN